MTNPKDEEKRKVSKKGKSEWKKVENVARAVTTMSNKAGRKTTSKPHGHRAKARRDSAPVPPADTPADMKKILVRRVTYAPANMAAPLAETNAANGATAPKKTPRTRIMDRRRSSAAILLKEPDSELHDPQTVYKNTVYELIKNTFSLAFGEDDELRINVDNVYPMLKTIGLNPKSESVMDLVRDASMESTGDIDPADFEKVIMAMVKVQDGELWGKRLEEKEYIRIEKESERAKAEAEKLRIQLEREKAGFEQEEEEEKDEWQEYDKQKEEEEKEKKKEAEIDELYDNLRMAFRFIDSDGDGVISTQDIYNLMMGLGEMMTDDELFGIVNLADLDCDGKVTFDDFRRFLATAEELEALDKEQTEGEQKLDEVKEELTEEETTNQEVNTENVEDTADGAIEKQESVEKAVVEADKTEETKAPEPVAPTSEDEEKLRRRKSMLWGYMKTASTLVTAMQTPVAEKPKEESEDTSDKPSEVTTDKPSADTEATPALDAVDGLDPSGQLDAIREEDEHSNYDLEETDRVENMDSKLTNVGDGKRKIVSRQSSTASIKVQGLAGNDSVGDSGFDTMNESETRDQPDVFELTDDEEELSDSKKGKLMKKRGSLSTCDIYTTDNEDDEDMVEAHHVHESLSRVSSMESMDDVKDKLPSDDDDKESRVLSFVNQHMYIDIRQDSTDSNEEKEPEVEPSPKHVIDENKMARAAYLQKAILRRSATAPALTVTTSRVEKHSTPKPSVNGLVCSHIDIDLTCESPPKADIKSTIKFNERVKSARQSRPRPESAMSNKTITVVDISDPAETESNLSQSARKQRWPVRPLTRPRSPCFRRVSSATRRRKSASPEPCDLSIDVISDRTPRSRPTTPFIRPRSSLTYRSEQTSPRRPQTARSYSTTRTIETPITKYERKENISLVVTEPFKNKEELYPRKDLLTTYHHGFKSIWPIGRKANLIRNNRPFSGFEMNSYSRSIERSELPLHIEENVSKLQPDSNKTIPVLKGKSLLTENKVIKLELDGTQMDRPVSRNSTLFMPSRDKQVTRRVLCQFR